MIDIKGIGSEGAIVNLVISAFIIYQVYLKPRLMKKQGKDRRKNNTNPHPAPGNGVECKEHTKALTRYGEQIKNISDHYMVRAATDEIVGSKARYYVDVINTQVLISSLGDCPQCGCELEQEEQGQGRFVWMDTECSNCDYASSDEPDWDTMPGGYAYDC